MTWQQDLRESITTADELKEYLKLNTNDTHKLQDILNHFPMAIPRYYLSLIDWDNPDDPILKMCVPSIQETNLDGAFDTSGEASNTVVPGLQHKYKCTTLFLSTNQCAMYCRYCFRKRLVGISEKEIGYKYFDKILDYINSHSEISNVLISGGDSFMNSNQTIEHYLKSFSEIKHLDCIRFGTRTPVSFPARITKDPELLKILKTYNDKKQIFIVTHYNHPNEITEESSLAIKLLQQAGMQILNQTVLLKGVNNDPEVLGTLLKRLTTIGVIPYYTFQCRPVSGVKNQFQVPIDQGYQIVEAAKQMQNGIAKSVRYIMSHENGKIEILGPANDGDMLFKYHQAKSPNDTSRIFGKKLADGQCWL